MLKPFGAGLPRAESRSSGFTLIELLIVVAIIAILASIAVSNFLEAQVRAKVSRASSDLRSIATALESYRVDKNRYPPTPIDGPVVPDPGDRRDERLAHLTTPIAYMTSIPNEVFVKNGPSAAYAFWNERLNDAMKVSPVYFYLPEEKHKRGRWVIFSRGPDIDYEADVAEGGTGLLQYYDPTNGTVSSGDVMRFGP